MDVWECDLLDVRALGKVNDKYVFILSVIDVVHARNTFCFIVILSDLLFLNSLLTTVF